MKQIWSSLKKYRNTWIFIGIILLFGIGVGIYFGVTCQNVLTNTLTNYVLDNQSTHFSITHFTVLSILLISSFLLIGIPLAISYLFYEGMSIGFCITLFSISFHLRGFLYIVLFLIITKIVYIVIFSYFFIKILNIGRNIISWIIYKNHKRDQLVHQTIGCLILILLIFGYDLFLDFVGMNLVNFLSFLLR